MNNLFYQILFSIPPIRRFAQKQYQNLKMRYFQGASSNRLVADWVAELESINKALKYEFKSLLARSRDLAANNDYIKGFLKRCVTNIVGPNGFILQNRALKNNEPDDNVNQEVEDKWYEWCKKYAAREITFTELQKLAVKQWKRDGNVLIRKLVGKDTNKFGFKIELLNIEQLDLAYNDRLSNGNVVIMGVEFNRNNERVAYWIKVAKPEKELSYTYTYNTTRDSIRIPAEEIYHFFTRDFPNQVIGYPATASSLITMHQLHGYDDAAIVSARAGAHKMGFIQSQPNQTISGAYRGDGEDSDGNIISSFSVGEIEQLPAGLEFKGWDPSYPNGEYAPFVKQILRKAATGLGVAYANWVGDLEAVSFSSMRTGVVDERDNWKDEQMSFVEGLLEPIFNDWLKYAMLSNQVNISFAEYDRINQPEFIGRRWDWVDPRADVEAKVMALKNNLTTLTDVMAEMGVGFEDYIRRRKRELEKLKDVRLLENELYPEKNAVVKTIEPQNNNGNGNGKSLKKYLEVS